LRSGWSVVRSVLLAKGGTLKKRSSLHLHKVLTQSNKLSPRTFETALIISLEYDTLKAFTSRYLILYILLFQLALIMRGRVPSQKEIKQTLVGILISSIFLGTNAFAFPLFACWLR
jgi:hypothetical protein